MIRFSYYDQRTDEAVELSTEMEDITTTELCGMFQRFLLAMGYVLPENSSVQIVEDDV